MSGFNEEHMLIRRLVEGDAAAFEQIYEKYNVKVYLFSFSNLKNRQDAEGVVQEVFYALWKERGKLKNVQNLDAWIFTICFNIIRKHFRRLSRENSYLEHAEHSGIRIDTGTVSEVEYNNLLAEAEKIIDQLPPRQKHIFLLNKRKGLSPSEISKKLNISKKTVENQLSMAKTYLRKAFVDESLLTLLFFALFLN